MSREDEDAYNGKKMDNLPKDWNKPEKASPEEVAKKEEADQAAADGAKAIADAGKTEDAADKAADVAKTAAIKNIQKAHTARILKRLDDGQPLVEVARKMKAIEGMQPQINDMERRLGIMQSVEPVLENAIKTLQKVVDVRGMGKK